MDVVATQRGKYGPIRQRGERFTISGKEAFSSRWMVKANTPEAREALTERAQSRRGLTSGQIAAEAALATGTHDDGSTARIAALEAQIKALTSEVSEETPTEETSDDGETSVVEPPKTRTRRK